MNPSLDMEKEKDFILVLRHDFQVLNYPFEILLKIINSDTRYTVQNTFFFLSEYVVATANYIKYISYNKYQITLKYIPAHEFSVGKRHLSFCAHL